MKKISVVIPSYNEENSIRLMYETLISCFHDKLSMYDYEIIFIDDFSKDATRKKIEEICNEDKKVKAIFNAKNFGYTRNVFFSLKQGTGDAVFMVFGDMQDPPGKLVDFVARWEEGYKVILGQKVKSKESKVLYFLRTTYYKLMESASAVQQIQHFNGFGLYDRDFIEVIKEIDDSQPYFKGIISEFSFNQVIVPYIQNSSKRGKSNVNFSRAYDAAMIGITSYTKFLMRMSTFIGALVGVVSVIIAAVAFFIKLTNWNAYPFGTAALTIGVFFLGAVQLFFIGILGEYILAINTRTMKRPLVAVERWINFDEHGKIDAGKI